MLGWCMVYRVWCMVFDECYHQIPYARLPCHTQEHQRIRDFIEFHHAQQQASSQSGDTNPSLTEVKAAKSIPLEKEKLKKALGMKTYSVDIHPEEFNSILDSIHTQLHTQTPKSPSHT
ncbi:hypothetical protein EON65_50975, partial [archaeon]